MRYQPAHAAPGGSVLSELLRAPMPLRVALSSAFAAALFVPAIVVATPASAAAGDVTVSDEIEEEGEIIAFSVTREAGGTSPVEWTAKTVDGTAKSGTNGDFTAVAGETVTFDDTQDDTQIVYVTTSDDALDEADESFTLELSAPGATTVVGTATITDNDDPPTYSLSAATNPVLESAGKVTVTATLSEASGRNLTIPVKTTEGTALASNDYTALAGGAAIQIAAGQTTGTIDVNITNDTTYEEDQSFTVEESNAPVNVSASLGGNSVEVTINDNDEKPTVSIGGAGTVTEGGDLAFPLTLSHKSEPEVEVTANTEDGTAKAPGDYNAAVGQVVTFASNEVNQTLIVSTNDDNLDEVSPESLTAKLSAPDNATLATMASATGGITDDDTAPGVTLSPSSVTETDTGTDTRTFTLTLDKPAGQPVKIGYATSDGTATATKDYTAATGTVTIPTGQSTGTFTVDFLGDKIHEGDEGLNITLSSPDMTVDGASLGAQPVTITDNDAVPTYSVADVAEFEGNSGAANRQFTVELSNPSSMPIDLVYSTADDSAVSTTSGVGANDFVSATSQSVTIPAGATSATFNIAVNGDAVYETNEGATVTVSRKVGETDVEAAPALGGQHTATLTIKNDDAKPTLTLNTQTGYEGTNLRVIATVNGATQVAVPLTVDAQGDDVGGTMTAALASDYDFELIGSPTIEALATTGTKISLATIALNRDNTDEPQEVVEVTVTGAKDPVSSLYKINDDPSEKPPAVSIGDETIGEEEGSVTLTVELTPDGDTTSWERDTVIPWMTVDGTAGKDFDYTEKSGTLTIPAGSTSGTINVPIEDDEVDEVNQSFWVKLGNVTPSDAVVTRGTAKVTIFDNDETVAPTITAPKSSTPKYVTISGKTQEGGTVELWTAPYANGDDFDKVETVVARNDGSYSFTRFLPNGYRVYTRTNGEESRILAIKAIQLPVLNATAAKGTLAFTVQANPKLGGQAVQIQRANSNGTWTTVARGTTASNSLYKVTLRNLKPGSYTFRAWVGGDTDEGTLAGYSVSKRYTVR